MGRTYRGGTNVRKSRDGWRRYRARAVHRAYLNRTDAARSARKPSRYVAA